MGCGHEAFILTVQRMHRTKTRGLAHPSNVGGRLVRFQLLATTRRAVRTPVRASLGARMYTFGWVPPRNAILGCRCPCPQPKTTRDRIRLHTPMYRPCNRENRGISVRVRVGAHVSNLQEGSSSTAPHCLEAA